MCFDIQVDILDSHFLQHFTYLSFALLPLQFL